MMRRSGLILFSLAVLSSICPAMVMAKTLPKAATLLMAAVASAKVIPQSAAVAAPVPAAPVPYTGTISRTDLIALTKPAIVRVLTHFEGTTTVPSFDVNLETLTWSVGAGASELVPYADDFLGSGFIVHPDGFIVTNSHVVSSEELRMSLAQDLAAGIVIEKALTLTRAENAKLEALGYTSEQFQKLVTDGISFVADHLSGITPLSVTVLKPDAPVPATTTSAFNTQILNSSDEALQRQITALIQTGVPADIVAVNDKFLDDEKDVAILKVNETGLPAIGLAKDSSAVEGNSVYVFGFPSSADINGFNGEPSFTLGTVNALKDSTQHTFKYIQTDAKVSPGSSGGPMLNGAGSAVGVLTLQSSGGNGDSFAFAIPIDLVEPILESHSIATTTGDYTAHYLAGLTLETAKHCKAATVEYTAAATANAIFGSVAPYVGPHLDACAALIASGQSIDSLWDEIRNWAEQLGLTFWISLLVGIVLVIVAVFIIFRLMRRMRKDEAAIKGMGDGSPAPAVVAPAMPPVHVASSNLELAAYVQQARESGQIDSEIRTGLLGAGWDEASINENLRP